MRDWLPYEPVSHPRDQDLETDVCVIGTGAGGAVFASELAEAGTRVVLLEQGGLYTRRDFTQDEATMMPRLFERGGGRTTDDGGITLLHGRCVGGGTTVNWAICFDPPGRVLESWREGLGLPAMHLADWRPSLDKVRFVLNVQKMQAEELNENARLLIKGATALGMRGERFEHSRTACLGSGFCILGCAYDRKQSMLVTYVPRAIRHGATLLAQARATGFEREGPRIRAVLGELTDPSTGTRRRLRVRARHVAVAAGALGTPALLQRAGLANASGRLGKNLALHPTSAVLAIFDHPVRGFEGIHYGAYVPDLEPEGILIESVFAYPALAASTMLRGGREAQRAMSQYDHWAGGIVLLHDDSRGDVQATGPEGARVRYALNAADQAKMRKGLLALANIFLAAGAREVLIPHAACGPIRSPEEAERVIASLDLSPNRLALFSAHQMGTAAMGRDPASSVTDGFGRVHGMENLWIADGSLFPTSLGVNPQITIAALADRNARHLLAHWQEPAASL
ncbi:MAG: GMC family oxidoreductase [Candidatus Sericytochromatia bacterium]|nr:GMC family oxidoreductase [Candidatus Sericytochromatia bacterium]